MATWSGDGKEVPAEVRAALAAGLEGPADAHVHVRAGIGSLLGDTHLILVGGRLRIVGRKTSLDPFEEVELTGRPHLDESGYRPVLVFPTAEGEQRLEVTALEEPAVEDLLEALPPALPPLAAAPALEVEGQSGAEELAGPRPSTDQVRSAFVSLLVRRLKQRRAEILARRHTRLTASLDRARGTHRSSDRSSDERWRSRHGRKPARRPSPPGPAEHLPQSPLLRLLLLALVGAAIFGLFAFLGRVASGRP